MKQNVVGPVDFIPDECEPVTVPVVALRFAKNRPLSDWPFFKGLSSNFSANRITMISTPTNESRLRRMTGVRSIWSPAGTDNFQNEYSAQVKTEDVDASAVGERYKRRHEDISSPGGPDPMASGANLEDATSAANVEESFPEDSERQSPEGESFPKKIGTNEWLHADGQVYKKLMFVIRKDQSEALDVVLAAGRPKLGEDRSEVVRNLLDHAGIQGGDDAVEHLSE